MRAQVLAKAKIKPYQKSVVKFREILVKYSSPYEKLFALKELKQTI